MVKLFISQPMRNRTDAEIKADRNILLEKMKKELKDDIILIDSLVEEDPPEHVNPGLWYLGKSFEFLSEADVAVFAKGWEACRGCKMEYLACQEYSIITWFEENPSKP